MTPHLRSHHVNVRREIFHDKTATGRYWWKLSRVCGCGYRSGSVERPLTPSEWRRFVKFGGEANIPPAYVRALEKANGLEPLHK